MSRLTDFTLRTGPSAPTADPVPPADPPRGSPCSGADTQTDGDDADPPDPAPETPLVPSSPSTTRPHARAHEHSASLNPPTRPLRRPLLLPSMRVGLLGGSFNPAHDGHRHISLVALRRLRLDRIVWLLSPQNPLKPVRETAAIAHRLDRAQRVARHPRILVSDLERTLRTRYTADTLPALSRLYPGVHFVWLMGADNLLQLNKWERWTRIMETMPVAVIDRPGYSLKAQLSAPTQRFAQARLPEEAAGRLAGTPAPSWVYLHAKLHPLSASAIRRTLPPGAAWTDHPLDDDPLNP